MDKKRLLTFLLVGAIAYILEIGALYIFRHSLKLSPVASVAISFWVGFCAAFFMQKLITFRNKQSAPGVLAKQLFWYSCLALFNYLFSLLLVQLLQRQLSVFIIRTIAVAFITVWNFMLYKYIFKSPAIPLV